jgi:hypothetical protein
MGPTTAAAAAAGREQQAARAESTRSGRQSAKASAVAQADQPQLLQQPDGAASPPPVLAEGNHCARRRRPQGTQSRSLADQRGLLPQGFSSWEQRLAYYEQRQLDSFSAWLDYHDALHGRQTPAERLAREADARLSAR